MRLHAGLLAAGLVLPAAAPAAVLAQTIAPSAGAPVVREARGPASHDAFSLSCETGPFASDYRAETGGVRLTDPDAKERGVAGGLVRMMGEGGKRALAFTVPHGRIRAIVRARRKVGGIDRLDLVFTSGRVVVVHTRTANAGLFTGSDVYELRLGRAGAVDQSALAGDQDGLEAMTLALPLYQPVTERCDPGGGL